MTYRQILLAVDLSQDSEAVGARAVALARQSQAGIVLAHVVTPVYPEPIYGGVPALPLDLEAQLVEAAREALSTLAGRLGLAAADCVVRVGTPKTVILDLARERGADLIVVGSHGVHGLGLLLGSTANGVLHGAPCDVLAVRVHR